MKKYIFYPILYSVNPILLLLATNISDLSLSQLFPIILIAPLVAAVLLWLFNRPFKEIHRAGFVVSLTTFWFFHYGTLHLRANAFQIESVSLGSHAIFFPLWTILFLFLVSRFLWHKITSPQTITLYLNLATILLVGYSLVRISLGLIPRLTTRSQVSEIIQTLSSSPAASELPDIYYIILDGYAGEDVLQQIYHYDNSAYDFTDVSAVSQAACTIP